MVTEPKSSRLTTEIIKKVEEQAKKEGRSFSNMVQRILEEYFRKRKS